MPDPLNQPPDPELLKKILGAREHAHADAWFRKDKKTLGALLSPDFVEINSSGRFSREEILERLFPTFTLHSFTIDDPVLKSTGENSAMLIYRCREAYSVNGKRSEGTFTVSATYRRQDNQYQLAVWEIRPVD
jgi:hypothetical protein